MATDDKHPDTGTHTAGGAHPATGQATTWPRSQFPDDSDDDYLEDEAGPLDEDAAIATLPPLTDEDRALINKLVHSMRLLDVGISSAAAHEAAPATAPVPFPELPTAGSPDAAPFAPRTTTIVPPTVRPSTPAPEDEDAIPMLTDVVNVQRYHPDQLPRNGQMNHALAPVISRAVETMTRDVHDTLNRLIRDIVARAVNEEITRLHAEMARQNHDD